MNNRETPTFSLQPNPLPSCDIAADIAILAVTEAGVPGCECVGPTFGAPDEPRPEPGAQMGAADIEIPGPVFYVDAL